LFDILEFLLIQNSIGMNISAKATRSLNFLRHCIYNAATSIKSSAYKCIVCPVLEYACPVWHPHTAKNINVLESVQRIEELPAGLPTAGGFLHHTVGASPLMTAFKS